MNNHHSKDYNANLNLLALYAEKVDSGDAKGMSELFRNADVQWGVDAPIMHEYDAMLELYEKVIKLHSDGTPRTHHIITNPIIEIGEDGFTATARTYFTEIQQTIDFPPAGNCRWSLSRCFAKENDIWEYRNRKYLWISEVISVDTLKIKSNNETI